MGGGRKRRGETNQVRRAWGGDGRGTVEETVPRGEEETQYTVYFTGYEPRVTYWCVQEVGEGHPRRS